MRILNGEGAMVEMPLKALEDEFVEEEVVGEEVGKEDYAESPASSPETDPGKRLKKIDSLLNAGDDPSDDGEEAKDTAGRLKASGRRQRFV